MPKVLPCPFCGGENTKYDPELDIVFCNDCHAESGLDGLGGWNKRDALGAVPAVIRHIKDKGVPLGVGKTFAARLSRAAPVPEDDADALFKRDLTEALVTLMKALRAEAERQKLDTDRPAQ